MRRMPKISREETEAKIKWLEAGLDKTWKAIEAIEERQHKILILMAKIIHDKKGVSGVLKAIIIFTAIVVFLIGMLMCQTIGG